MKVPMQRANRAPTSGRTALRRNGTSPSAFDGIRDCSSDAAIRLFSPVDARPPQHG